MSDYGEFFVYEQYSLAVMVLCPEICRQARMARDARFDGHFFVGAGKTGVVCRPVCTVRPAAVESARYFPSLAAARGEGFRPCPRCRPEGAPRLPEWTLTSPAVVRGLRLIDQGYLDEHPTDQLAARLGVSSRHLNRLFVRELSATPVDIARGLRITRARLLLDGSSLALAEVAMRAGFGSVRRFNDELRACYGCTPQQLRGGGPTGRSDRIHLELPVRGDYHADWVFGFLEDRALPGVEFVEGHRYRRALPSAREPVDHPSAGVGEAEGGPVDWLEVSWNGSGLRVTVPERAVPNLAGLLARVRRTFDLDADPAAVESVLSNDPLLARGIARDPGLRVPGAWDGFEIAVRAILGQQVSVARARNLAIALCQRFGGGTFPAPAALADADVSAIGMPGKRGEAVRGLARAVLEGRLVLDETAGPASMTEALTALPGVGPWTAGYIGMRVGRDPDAYPDSDWVVLKMLEARGAEARRRAEQWRPWRASAVMVLWRMAGVARTQQARTTGGTQ
jgi:AraC family transcriptional regulator of adaptative response / DNA-3-methyladenine glycosylase II